jgi:hypothetical protein
LPPQGFPKDDRFGILPDRLERAEKEA